MQIGHGGSSSVTWHRWQWPCRNGKAKRFQKEEKMRLFTKSFLVFLLVLLSMNQLALAQTTATDQKQAVKVVNINTASLTELEGLPGIGPSLAQKIVDFRTKNGNFKTAADLMAVSGIGEKKYESLKSLITVAAK
jgi:competence protein ComEA